MACTGSTISRSVNSPGMLGTCETCQIVVDQLIIASYWSSGKCRNVTLQPFKL